MNFPDAVPVLSGEELFLRELTEADIPSWYERAIDLESADLAGDSIPESIEVGATWLQRHQDRFRQQAAIRWAIVLKGSIDSIGTIGLAIVSKERGIGELGFVIARAHWGKGVGTSAATLVKGYAFSALGLTELRAEVLQRNPASIRLLEKLGFRLLHTIPGDTQSGGDSEDCFLYVLQNAGESTA
ncbi:GNAT family N-acetyltransferase [Phormidesmis sp. 146-12]